MMQNFQIPNKHYFTIGEVSKLCSVEAHVLRYWEQEFQELAPVRRRGQRRYYSRQEIQLIRKIMDLLYDKGFTIQGAKKQLKLDSAREIEDPKLEELNRTIVELNKVVEILSVGSRQD